MTWSAVPIRWQQGPSGTKRMPARPRENLAIPRGRFVVSGMISSGHTGVSENVVYP